MKIIRLHDASGAGPTFTVGDNNVPHGNGTPTSPKGWIVGLSGGYDMASEAVPLVDSESIESFERMNESTSLEVSADYGFASEADRDVFALELQGKVPRLAHVEVIVGQTVRWVPKATTRPIRWQPIGEVACLVTFNLVGGKMTVTRPDNVP